MTVASPLPQPQAVPHLKAPAEGIPSWQLMGSGILLIALSANRWGVEILAWVAPVPFLLLARRSTGWRSWSAILLALIVATGLQVAKIVTPPIPYAMVPAFSLPAAVGMFLTLLGTEWVRRRAGEVQAVAAFACLVALWDWVTYATSYMGAWGTSANTQLENLPLLQVTSLFGIASIGLLMGGIQATLALALGHEAPRRYKGLYLVVCSLLALTFTYGSIRLFTPQEASIPVGAVVTDLGLTAEGLPTRDQLLANTDRLFERTRLAARRGARLVVWNEAAALMEPAEEAAFVLRAQSEARTLGIDLVLAYAVLASHQPPLLDNKYLFLSNEGQVLQRYRKHHPVPGEPSMKGTEALRAIQRPYGKVSGAICYDFDFPTLTREHARQGTGLFAVPASDWAGIDPYHTQMARVRAIEGGFSVVRAVRWAASGGFDAYGRVRGWMPVSEENDRVMVVTVPTQPVRTLYAQVGDWPLLAIALALAAIVIGALRPRRAP